MVLIDQASHQEGSQQSFLDRAQTWVQEHLGGVFVIFFALSFICFVIWLVTLLVFPARDSKRDRTTLTLANGGRIVVDYPTRFLADNLAQPVYLTADTPAEAKLFIQIPDYAPLIVESVTAMSPTVTANVSGGSLVVGWLATRPPITTSGITSPTTELYGIAPVLGQPHTVTLNLKNARLFRGPWFLSALLGGFQQLPLTLVTDTEPKTLNVKIETTDRATWRDFARNYSFLPVLPLVVSGLTALAKVYIDYQRSQRKEARTAMEDLLRDIAQADEKTIERYNNLLKTRLVKYIPNDELDEIERVMKFIIGKHTYTISVEEFKARPEVWVGALCLAAARVVPNGKAEADRTTRLPRSDVSSDDSERLEAVHTSEPSREEELAQRHRTELYRYMRIFPVDLLQPEGERRLRELRKRLGFSTPQNHHWPRPAARPQDYPTDLVTTRSTIADLRLFPSKRGDAIEEVGYLFSEKAWYWREHPIHDKVKEYPQPILVCGDEGSGRTALALALTRYAEDSDKVLGVCLNGPKSITQVQESLAAELLSFIQWHTTLLSMLTREDRELLAYLLSGVLNTHQVLSALSNVEPKQFIVLSEADKANLPLWKIQAEVELRLLVNAVQQIQGKPPLQTPQWFYILNQCAKKLGFLKIRIALDMTAEQFEKWRCDSFGQFLSVLPVEFNAPVQLLIFVPGQPKDFELARYGVVIEQIRWDFPSNDETNYLVRMLKHRYTQRNGGRETPPFEEFVSKETQREICDVARYNPRSLAVLWNKIATTFASKKQLTIDIIKSANR